MKHSSLRPQLQIIAMLLVFIQVLCILPLSSAQSRIFQEGDTEADVLRIHQQLQLLNYLDHDPGEVYSAETVQAVMRFQKDNGLLATGMVDDITWQALFADDARAAQDNSHEDFLLFESEESAAMSMMAPSAAMTGMSLSKNAYAFTQGTIPWNTDEYTHIQETGFVSTRTSPLSTFAADADTASYGQLRARILRGEAVPPDSVRVEEMLNYFHYDYPQPQAGEPFGVSLEVGPCPWNEGTLLLQIGLQAESIPEVQRPDENLVFLIDTSGSMYGTDRLDLVKRAFLLMLDTLKPTDTVSIVAYASMDTVVLEGASASEKTRIMEALTSLEAHGSTNGSAGLMRAYEIAEKYKTASSVNRILMATDGDLNVGLTSEGDLARLVLEKKEAGIQLTMLGFGYGNFKDNKMEALALYGDGNYWYLDTIHEARKALVTEAGGTFLTIAKDVKLQVDFNPSFIKGYRLIGYEDRLLQAEDFDNDQVDGGFIGSGHQVTALYEIVAIDSAFEIHDVQSKYLSPTPIDSTEWLTLHIRAKKPDQETSDLYSYPLIPDTVDTLSENMRFAAAIAQTAMLLRNSPYRGSASYDQALALVRSCEHALGDVYREEFLYLLTCLHRENMTD